jgi:hypothetical protein
MEVYKEILNQLGGNKFLTMTGSKNLLYSSENPNWLSMHLIRNKIGAKYLKIKLTSMDLYTLTFSTSKKVLDKSIGIKVDTHVILKVVENVYFDMLQNIFTNVTGLNTHL